MFRRILDERKRREIDPMVAVLQECYKEAAEGTLADSYTTERLHTALMFFEAMIPLYDELRQLPAGSVQNLVKLKSTLKTLLEQG